jgi:hypothetical protein
MAGDEQVTAACPGPIHGNWLGVCIKNNRLFISRCNFLDTIRAWGLGYAAF